MMSAPLRTLRSSASRRTAFAVVILAFGSVLAIGACGGDAEAPDGSGERVAAQTAAASPTPATIPVDSGEALYPWVDGLNLRAEPSTGARVVGRATRGQVLRATGPRSGAEATVLLRGGVYTEPWYRVTTEEGTAGWAFGGALRREGEAKGHPPVSHTRIDHEHFGAFDLTDWQLVGEENVGGEELDGTRRRYRKGARVLEVEEVTVGEAAYTRTQRLLERDGAPVRVRELRWVSDADADHLLTETVTDLEAEPVRRYVREQRVPVHLHQLGGLPTRVVGTWQRNDLERAAALAELRPQPDGTCLPDPAEVALDALALGEWRSEDDARAVLVIEPTSLAWHRDDGSAPTVEPYRLAARCPDALGGDPTSTPSPGRYLVVGGEAPRCLYLVRADAEALELSHVGRGNTLRYRRVRGL